MLASDKTATIPARFREIADRCGDSPCIFADAGPVSFRALDAASDALASQLMARGLSAHDRIGLLCPNGADFVVTYMGILKAGATVVPLNLLLNPKEIAYILRDSDAKALFFEQSFAAAARAALVDADGVRERFCIGTSEAADATSLSPLELRAEGAGAGGESSRLDSELAVILYTSGTTGRPKGAMLTHANLLANTASVKDALDLGADDRILVVLPMFHAFAATVGMLTPLLHGFGVIPVPRFDPKQLTHVVEAQGATVFLGVPSMFGALLRLDDAALARWSGVRFCVSGGAAMPLALLAEVERRLGVPVLEGDGPTECGPVTCVNPRRGRRKSGSVGPPVPGVEMSIRDQKGEEVADGATGEVCVRGANVMRGYLNLPDATRESFFGDWFRTGDLGYRDEDGYFYLVDRLKDLIITNGMNVYPRVIEEVLYAHPDVAEAAVVGDPDERHGEVPVAHISLRPGASTAPAALRAWCRQHLGRHEIPRRITLHEALPKSSSGKILKRELRRSGEHERGVPL